VDFSVQSAAVVINTNRHGKSIHVNVGMLWQVFTMQMESVKITKKMTTEWYR